MNAKTELNIPVFMQKGSSVNGAKFAFNPFDLLQVVVIRSMHSKA